MNKLAMLFLAVALGGCASSGAPVSQPDIARVLKSRPGLVPTKDDVLLAYSPARYYGNVAGHGVSQDLDVSAACGCADIGSSSSSPGGSQSVTPDIDHKKKTILKVQITLKPHPR